MLGERERERGMKRGSSSCFSPSRVAR